jgi:hypothetical protein
VETSEHRGQPRSLELWVGGAWLLGIVMLLGAGVLFLVGGEYEPAHPALAWTLFVGCFPVFVLASLLQRRYFRSDRRP